MEAISESGLDEFLKEYSPPELTAYPSSSTTIQSQKEPSQQLVNNVVKTNNLLRPRIMGGGTTMNMGRLTPQVLMPSQTSSRPIDSSRVVYYSGEQVPQQQRVIRHPVYAKSNPSPGPMRIINRQSGGGINLNLGRAQVLMPSSKPQNMGIPRVVYYPSDEKQTPQQRVIRHHVYPNSNTPTSMRVLNRQSGINLNMGRAASHVLMPLPNTHNIGTPRVIYCSADQQQPSPRVIRHTPINQKVYYYGLIIPLTELLNDF